VKFVRKVKSSMLLGCCKALWI